MTLQTNNVEKLKVTDMTPNEIVEWFAKIWENMECEYYERTDSNET